MPQFIYVNNLNFMILGFGPQWISFKVHQNMGSAMAKPT
jgi:hypothetical protein